MSHPDIQITDASEKLVYQIKYGNTKDAMLWTWRELLLSAVINSKTITLAKNLAADVTKLGFAQEMLKRLDEEVSGKIFCRSLLHPPVYITLIDPPNPSEGYLGYDTDEGKAARRRDLLLNAHWSPEMRAAVPKARALFAVVAAPEKLDGSESDD